MQAEKTRKYRIKNWDKDEQPREKLLSKGPRALSNTELLAVLIGTGTPDRNAVDTAREVLKLGDNNLITLGQLSATQIRQVKGMGRAKAAIISAAMELGRRRDASLLNEKKMLKHGRDAAAYLQSELQHFKHEVFVAIYLNNACKVLKWEPLSQGGLTGTVADPRIILKKALEENAVNIILGHNHPSGNLRPSKADEELTHKIKEGARFLDIKLLDHIIVSEQGYFSFADSGLL
jgi:DNA repair protein RadC